jgi:hypothetical protein
MAGRSGAPPRHPAHLVGASPVGRGRELGDLPAELRECRDRGLRQRERSRAAALADDRDERRVTGHVGAPERSELLGAQARPEEHEQRGAVADVLERVARDRRAVLHHVGRREQLLEGLDPGRFACPRGGLVARGELDRGRERHLPDVVLQERLLGAGVLAGLGDPVRPERGERREARGHGAGALGAARGRALRDGVREDLGVEPVAEAAVERRVAPAELLHRRRAREELLLDEAGEPLVEPRGIVLLDREDAPSAR